MGKFSSGYQRAVGTQKMRSAAARMDGRPSAPRSNRSAAADNSKLAADRADLARKLQEQQQLNALKNSSSSASPSTPWSTGGRKNRNG